MTGGEEASREQEMQRRHRRVAFRAGGVAVVMLGLAFASVPLYRMFCQATGFAGTTQRAESRSTVVLNKTVIMRFDANVAGALKWSFEPVKTKFKIKIGETRVALFRATNLSDKPVTGTATFNVAPEAAGAYFNKLECFCFTEQTLQPGQSVEMPVSFFVDPEFVKNRATRNIAQITLSYTFFPIDQPKPVVKSGKQAQADVKGKQRLGKGT